MRHVAMTEKLLCCMHALYIQHIGWCKYKRATKSNTRHTLLVSEPPSRPFSISGTVRPFACCLSTSHSWCSKEAFNPCCSQSLNIMFVYFNNDVRTITCACDKRGDHMSTVACRLVTKPKGSRGLPILLVSFGHTVHFLTCCDGMDWAIGQKGEETSVPCGS